MVDFFTRWIGVARLNNLTSEEVIKRMSSIFARHGIPEVVVRDNGPQYSSDRFIKFAQNYGFKHITSSPHYPQGNEEAERAVKTVKGLLRKSGYPYFSFLAYRLIPLECGYSPSQMLMSRTLRTTLPGTREQRIPKVIEISSLKEKDEQIKERQKRNYDQRHRTRDLLPLESGETVWIPDRESEGTVREEVSPRSHIVETADGSYRRNRRHFVRLPSSDIVQETEPSEDPEEQTRVLRSRSGRSSKPLERYDPSWT